MSKKQLADDANTVNAAGSIPMWTKKKYNFNECIAFVR